ncbi:hypothetical protein SLOPH_1224, partial [Spraguea lophii 42_110]
MKNILFEDTGIYFFENITENAITNNYNISALKIPVTEFFASKNHILIYNNFFYILERKENIYRIKKIIKTHLILFLLKIKRLSKNSRITIYNIIITLYKQKVKRLYKILEEFILWLHIETVDNIKIENHYLIIKRNN